MSKNSHLTLSERIEIERALRDGASFKEIGRQLEKDPSTISKEVRNHFVVKEGGSRFNPCKHRTICKHSKDICKSCPWQWSKACATCSHGCYKFCKDFEELRCPRHKQPPYVCNGCSKRQSCYLRKHLYEAKSAQKEYEEVRSKSRQGFAISPEELCRIDDIVSPLVQQGQSVHHICTNNADEIMLDEKTIYNYIDAGLLSVGNIDLPRKVRYRVRKKKKSVRVDKQCHTGRTYEDFLEYMAAHPDSERKQAILTEEAESQGEQDRITEMMEFIENHADQSLDYDEELVRLLVEKATIFENNVVVRFKSGIEIEV